MYTYNWVPPLTQLRGSNGPPARGQWNSFWTQSLQFGCKAALVCPWCFQSAEREWQSKSILLVKNHGVYIPIHKFTKAKWDLFSVTVQMGFLPHDPHPRQFAKKDGNQPVKLLYIHTHSSVCTQYTIPYRENPHLSHGHIIFYQHFGCSVLMNSVLSTTVQTRRHEEEYAAGWLDVPEYRKAQD